MHLDKYVYVTLPCDDSGYPAPVNGTGRGTYLVANFNMQSLMPPGNSWTNLDIFQTVLRTDETIRLTIDLPVTAFNYLVHRISVTRGEVINLTTEALERHRRDFAAGTGAFEGCVSLVPESEWPEQSDNPELLII